MACTKSVSAQRALVPEIEALDSFSRPELHDVNGTGRNDLDEVLGRHNKRP